MLRDALTASYFVAVWKMLRKKGCVPSALTQDVKDLLASREIEAILDNTDFMILLLSLIHICGRWASSFSFWSMAG